MFAKMYRNDSGLANSSMVPNNVTKISTPTIGSTVESPSAVHVGVPSTGFVILLAVSWVGLASVALGAVVLLEILLRRPGKQLGKVLLGGLLFVIIVSIVGILTYVGLTILKIAIAWWVSRNGIN